MLVWILLAVTTVSVVFLWLYVGKLGEKLGENALALELLREEIEALKKDLVDL
jgi:hypothetical protein